MCDAVVVPSKSENEKEMNRVLAPVSTVTSPKPIPVDAFRGGLGKTAQVREIRNLAGESSRREKDNSAQKQSEDSHVHPSIRLDRLDKYMPSRSLNQVFRALVNLESVTNRTNPRLPHAAADSFFLCWHS